MKSNPIFKPISVRAPAGGEDKKAEFVITQKNKTVGKDVFYVEMFWIIQGKAED